jgi:two-component system, OmpR family, response regulator RegX3
VSLSSPQILIVEDESAISEPLAKLLAREGFNANVAATVADALAKFAADKPDLILLDLNLPDGDGRDVAREIRRSSGVPIIMLTARGTETDRIVGLEIGADDYVVKPFSSAEVIARIRAVLRRSEAHDDQQDQDLGQPVVVEEMRIDPGTRRAFLGEQELDLSLKEFDLLYELARNAGTVVSRDQLMTRVWDENWFGSTKTLDVHIGWLRRKLGDDANKPHWIETVRGIGFRFAGGEGSADS